MNYDCILFQSYVSCAWGLRGVGFVMATYGLTNAFFSLSIRWLVRLIGRVPAIMIAFLLHLSICAMLIMWHPTSSTRHVYFIISVMWGIADAIWIVQIICKYKSSNQIISENKPYNLCLCTFTLLNFLLKFNKYRSSIKNKWRNNPLHVNSE